MSASEACLEEVLPGTPGYVLEAAYGALSPSEKDAFRAHLLGFTSAEWLAETMRQHGHSVSASTIRTYRRSLEDK